MGPVVYRGVSEMRRNWKALVAIALLIGVVGAVVLTALAGAQRSSSALERFRERSLAADGTILTADEEGMAEVAKLPQVAAVGRIVVPFLAPLGPGTAARHRLVTTSGGLLTDVDRVRVIEGRVPSADRADEVALNERMAAALDVERGDKLVLHAFSPEQFASETGPESGPAGPTVPVRVVGIVRSTFDVADEVSEDRPSGYLSPAFYRQYGDEIASFDRVHRIRLRNGEADVAAFGEAARRIFADDPEFSFAPDTTDVGRVDDTIQVVAIGLRLFALGAAVAGLLALGQVLSLTVARTQADGHVLAGLGMSRGQRMGSSMLAVAPALAAGTVLAAIGAYLASPRMPINLARLAEPEPGFSFDALVLGAGSVVLAVLATALAFLAAWRSTRDPQASEGRAGTNGSVIVRAVSRFRWPPPAVTGAHMAFHRGSGASEVPVRSAIAGTVAGVASLVAVLVFIGSQHTLARTPPLYGWNWDASVLAPEFESGDTEAEGVSAQLVKEPAVGDVSLVRVSHVVIRDTYLHVLGFSGLKGHVEPTVLAGRAPRTPDEVAFGAATMKDLGLSVGDRVEVPGVQRPVSLRVVGRVVIPFLGTDAIADEGAAMTGDGADRLATTQDSFDLVFNWQDGVDAHAAGRRLEARVGSLVTEKPPTDVKNLARISAIPRALAIFLGGLAALAVSYALVATVRRRARDLAVLRALGFRRGQVSAVVAWQASLLTAVGLMVGIPVGVVVGRWAWTLVASAMGLGNQPSVPLLAVAVTALVALALANLVALVPARAAARGNPAVALRTE